MCSVISRVKPVQRALVLTLRLRAITEGSSYAAAEIRRFCPGLSAVTDPLKATSRSYCSRVALTEGLLFRQVRYYKYNFALLFFSKLFFLSSMPKGF